MKVTRRVRYVREGKGKPRRVIVRHETVDVLCNLCGEAVRKGEPDRLGREWPLYFTTIHVGGGHDSDCPPDSDEWLLHLCEHCRGAIVSLCAIPPDCHDRFCGYDGWESSPVLVALEACNPASISDGVGAGEDAPVEHDWMRDALHKVLAKREVIRRALEGGRRPWQKSADAGQDPAAEQAAEAVDSPPAPSEPVQEPAECEAVPR